MSPLEIFAVVTGLLSVWLCVKEKILTWPVGIVNVIAYGILFFQIKLYADLTLQGFFVVTGFIGWYQWAFGGKQRTARLITTLTRAQLVYTGIGSVLAVLVIGWLFATYTDASLPYLDSLISGFSVVAQVLLMVKKYENWYVWILVDVLSIGIYLYKGIPLTAGLYVVYLVLAIMGWREWRTTLARMKLAEQNQLYGSASVTA